LKFIFNFISQHLILTYFYVKFDHFFFLLVFHFFRYFFVVFPPNFPIFFYDLEFYFIIFLNLSFYEVSSMLKTRSRVLNINMG